MSEYHLTIRGRLPGMNELIGEERKHRQAGARMKKDVETFIRLTIKQQLKGAKPKPPVQINYKYYELNRRRDLDNVSGFAHKVIQDSLVKEGILDNDGWDYIAGFTDTFDVDAKAPRIEVTITEL